MGDRERQRNQEGVFRSRRVLYTRPSSPFSAWRTVSSFGGTDAITKGSEREATIVLIEYEIEMAEVATVDHMSARQVLTAMMFDVLLADGTLPHCRRTNCRSYEMRTQHQQHCALGSLGRVRWRPQRDTRQRISSCRSWATRGARASACLYVDHRNGGRRRCVVVDGEREDFSSAFAS